MFIIATLVKSNGAVTAVKLPTDHADSRWTETIGGEFEFMTTKRQTIGAAVRLDGCDIIPYGTDGGRFGKKCNYILFDDEARNFASSVAYMANMRRAM